MNLDARDRMNNHQTTPYLVDPGRLWQELKSDFDKARTAVGLLNA